MAELERVSMSTKSKQIPPSPFPPAVEGFQVLLLAGAVDPDVAVGILDAVAEGGKPNVVSGEGRE